jgi:TAT (twin-arginine translocation) pathway-exported protein
MDVSGKDSPSRRNFLKGIAAVGTATAVPFGWADHAEAAKKKKELLVFRLQTRKTVSCRACKIHHRFLIFLTRAKADQHRAHPGCNCPIVEQKLSRRAFRLLFAAEALRLGFVDLRKV